MEERELDEIIKAHELFEKSYGREGRMTNFQSSNLQGLNLRGVNLQKVNFLLADRRGADLQWSNMRFTDLRDADLREANLGCVDMRGANLRCVNMTWANMAGTNFPESTFFTHGEYYWICIHIQNGDHLRFGDHSHSIEDWRRFTKEDIERIDGTEAIKFYPHLLDIADFYTGKGARPDWLKEEL